MLTKYFLFMILALTFVVASAKADEACEGTAIRHAMVFMRTHFDRNIDLHGPSISVVENGNNNFEVAVDNPSQKQNVIVYVKLNNLGNQCVLRPGTQITHKNLSR